MDTVELITNILSVPTEHLYGVTVEQIFKRIGGSDQKKLNNAIADAIADFFKHGDIGEIYQDLKNLWYEDLKHSRIPLNRILTFVGLLESLTSHYPGLPKEKLDDAARKIHPYVVSKLVDDPRAEVFIKELKDEAGRKEAADKQAKRDAQAYDTNITVHEIKESLSSNGPVPSQPPVVPQTQADNQDYLEHFYAPLFLEKRKSKVTLASMYVSPHIKNIDKRSSAAECIMQWYNDDDIEPCLLLYGNAGVGKSSLVSKIIADANLKDGAEREFDLPADAASKRRVTVQAGLQHRDHQFKSGSRLFQTYCAERGDLFCAFVLSSRLLRKGGRVKNRFRMRCPCRGYPNSIPVPEPKTGTGIIILHKGSGERSPRFSPAEYHLHPNRNIFIRIHKEIVLIS